eukprot:14634052-Ditylum_brightwellii.AAC.1
MANRRGQGGTGRWQMRNNLFLAHASHPDAGEKSDSAGLLCAKGSQRYAAASEQRDDGKIVLSLKSQGHWVGQDVTE